jgi:hypothetical protein
MAAQLRYRCRRNSCGVGTRRCSRGTGAESRSGVRRHFARRKVRGVHGRTTLRGGVVHVPSSGRFERKHALFKRKLLRSSLTPALFAPPRPVLPRHTALAPLVSLRGPVAVVGRLEDVVRVRGGAREHPRQLRVPVQLLDILLALVHKVELRRDIAQVLPPRLVRGGVGASVAVRGRGRGRGRVGLG